MTKVEDGKLVFNFEDHNSVILDTVMAGNKN